MFKKSFLGIILVLCGACKNNMSDEDYLWLEEVEGQKALEWVRSRNKESRQKFGTSTEFTAARDEMIEIMGDKEKIPYPRIRGKFVYNYWVDAQNPKGIWRRTDLKSYLAKKPQWTVLLDMDKLSKQEEKSWVFGGVRMLYPDQKRCLVKLSPGGTDAGEYREFDLDKCQFIKGGFYIPVNKCNTTWFDSDTLLISTTLKDEDKTASGYAKQVRLWKRGTDIETAREIFTGKRSDVSVLAYSLGKPENKDFILYRGKTFYTRDYSLFRKGKVYPLALPEDCSIRALKEGRLFVELKSDWKSYKAGSLLSLNFELLLKNQHRISPVYQPTKNSSLSQFSYTGGYFYINVIEDVIGKVYQVSFENGVWRKKLIPLPPNGTVSIMTADDEGRDILFKYQSFLKPSTYFHYDEKSLKEYFSKKAKFDTSSYITEQHFAKSPDGTRVPYFLVRHKDMPFNGQTPVLLYGYGGFQISMRPYYSSSIGKLWLDKGGAYVLANIRGGGEYGPSWHQAALKFNKHKSYEDFIAIAEDLIQSKVTSPEKLAIKGGSNGGLLMGVMLTMRPDLFKSVICQVPLLDMLRFHKLLAGASWVGEYGNPENEKEKEYILSYSPFQNLKENHSYPEVFFMTSTKDDRVHPGHARKMAHKMTDMGYKVYYYENIEGGHGGAADMKQKADWAAMQYMYLYERLMGQE